MNPWNSISLSDYENHMRSDEVKQLQTLSEIMKRQFVSYPAKSVMVLGAAGGNGFEHIKSGKFSAVYAVDINPAYLDEIKKRFTLDELTCICADLTTDDPLPHADLLIADLLIEYIGYDCFAKVIGKVSPVYVSCVTQTDKGEDFVSNSPYIHAFDDLGSIHSQIDTKKLAAAIADTGYTLRSSQEYPLPNGKSLIQTDFIS